MVRWLQRVEPGYTVQEEGHNLHRSLGREPRHILSAEHRSWHMGRLDSGAEAAQGHSAPHTAIDSNMKSLDDGSLVVGTLAVQIEIFLPQVRQAITRYSHRSVKVKWRPIQINGMISAVYRSGPFTVIYMYLQCNSRSR